MTTLNTTTTQAPAALIAQRFIDDPALFALAAAEGCADMTDAELDDMDASIEWSMLCAACPEYTHEELEDLLEGLEAACHTFDDPEEVNDPERARLASMTVEEIIEEIHARLFPGVPSEEIPALLDAWDDEYEAGKRRSRAH